MGGFNPVDELEGWDGRSLAAMLAQLGPPDSESTVDLAKVPEAGVTALGKLLAIRGVVLQGDEIPEDVDLNAQWGIWTGVTSSTHVWFAEVDGQVVVIDAVRAGHGVRF